MAEVKVTLLNLKGKKVADGSIELAGGPRDWEHRGALKSSADIPMGTYLVETTSPPQRRGFSVVGKETGGYTLWPLSPYV